MSSGFGGLWRSLPKELRGDFGARCLKRGAVIRLYTQQTRPPKYKRLVIWGTSQAENHVAVSFINSSINPTHFPTKELRNFHLRLCSSGRSYLDHDSYLDCTAIFEWDLKLLAREIDKDPDIYLGKLSEDDLTKATKLIKQAPTISQKVKMRYGFL